MYIPTVNSCRVRDIFMLRLLVGQCVRRLAGSSGKLNSNVLWPTRTSGVGLETRTTTVVATPAFYRSTKEGDSCNT